MESNYFTSDQHILDKLKWVKMKFLDDRIFTVHVESVKLRFCFLCANKYCQTSSNHALLPFNESLQCGEIFVHILVNHCNNNKTSNYIHPYGRHCSKHSICIVSVPQYLRGICSMPVSPMPKSTDAPVP
jgi:hypothetical protein